MTKSGAGASGWHGRSRTQQVAGLDTHYVRARPPGRPDAPTLVLLHGFLVSSWAWRFNIGPLARRFSVLAPCQPGFGWSDRPRSPLTIPRLGRHLLDLLDALGIEQAHVCGNSLGGAVALWTALNAPDRVDRLVLVNALALPHSLPKIDRLAHAPGLAPIIRFFVRPTVARVGLQALAYRGLAVDSTYLAGFRAPWRARHSARAAVRVARGLRPGAEQIERELHRVSQPTLVCWGTGDRLLGGHTGHALAGRIPGARLVTFPSCGHCPHEEAPHRFNTVVERFLTAGATTAGDADAAR